MWDVRFTMRNRLTTFHNVEYSRATLVNLAHVEMSIVLSHKTEILSRLATGERLADIGRSLGVSAPAISKQLVDDPDYVMARQSSLDARMALREGELEAAETMIDVNKSSALLRHAMWRAEREAPSLWGQKSEVSHGVQIAVTINNPGARPALTIDHEE
jgi:hypothetical protein